LHNNPARPAAQLSSHAAARGRTRFAFAGLAHVLHPSPSSPAARLGLSWALKDAFAVPRCWAICSRFHYVHGPRPQIAFSLWLLATSSGAGTIARGNIHRPVALASRDSPLYTRQVKSSTCSTDSRPSCIAASGARAAPFPDSHALHTRHFDTETTS